MSNGVQSRTRVISGERSVSKSQAKMWTKKELKTAARVKKRFETYIDERVLAWVAARGYNLEHADLSYNIPDESGNLHVSTRFYSYHRNNEDPLKPNHFTIPAKFFTDADFAFKVSLGFFSEEDIEGMC